MATRGSNATDVGTVICGQPGKVAAAVSVAGVKACADLYFSIVTAKARSLDPRAVLRNVYGYFPGAAAVEDIEALLPSNIDADHMSPR